MYPVISVGTESLMRYPFPRADLVIAYVKRSSGGAYRALLAAKRKRKDIINIFELLLPENV